MTFLKKLHKMTSNHTTFFRKEISAQMLDFEQTLYSSAIELLNSGEILPCKYHNLFNGSFIVETSRRFLPRKGEHYQIFILDKKHYNPTSWNENGFNYYDLLKRSKLSSGKCVWIEKSQSDSKIKCGFSQVEINFNKVLNDDDLIFLGPKSPPTDYLNNLLNYSKSTRAEECHLLNLTQNTLWNPDLISDSNLRPDFFINQLEIEDTLLIQGPPGTGKTTLIGGIVTELLKRDKSILVTSMTNNALMEVAKQKSLNEFLSEHKILKSNLSTDEENDLNNLEILDELRPMKGHLHLSTFFNTSKFINALSGSYDYLIIDEASQAFLTTFSAFKNLATKNLWVGDHMQLAPIALLNQDKIRSFGALPIVNGFATICENYQFPGFMLEKTRRFGERGADYTSIFYEGKLKSAFKHNFKDNMIPKQTNILGGPIAINTNLSMSDKAPLNGFNKVKETILSLSDKIKHKDILVVTPFKKTVKSLKKFLVQNSIDTDVETVDSIQGRTVVVTIFLLCNVSYFFSLDLKRFNVATSRAILNTFIIFDPTIYSELDDYPLIQVYFDKMKNENSKLIDLKPEIKNEQINSF